MIYQPRREDFGPLFFIFLLPFLIALPELLGILNSDPALIVGHMTQRMSTGPLGAYAYIDPNNGFTTQALGYRAAKDWLEGIVPWWNPYSGVGLPLAGEYQPAAFFPLTLLLLLPNGMTLEHFLLQVFAGWGTYFLLRQLGISRTASLTGGLLFAFNGTLAWFDHASALPVPALPWMLLGIERAYNKSLLSLEGGWRILAISLGMNLLAGFPETAYLSGLMVLAWSIMLFVKIGPGFRQLFCKKIILGGSVGLALAAPQILAFFTYLPESFLGAHQGQFAHVMQHPGAILTSLIAPYSYGVIFANTEAWPPDLINIWGSIGGYVTIVLVGMALYGLFITRTTLAWLLFVCILVCLGKSYNIEPISSVMNFVPGIKETAFYRYCVPIWELSFILLAVFGLESLQQVPSKKYSIWLALPLLVTLVILFVFVSSFWPALVANPGIRNAAAISFFWAISTCICLFIFFKFKSPVTRVNSVAILLVADSVLMFAIPTLANPKAGDIDRAPVEFLQSHIGLQRFYTLGPIQANYSAQFGIASINHNYMPIAKRWVDWLQHHLDPYADPAIFTGDFSRDKTKPTQAQELRRNISNYQFAGVKYVVSPHGDNIFLEELTSETDSDGNKPVFLGPGESMSGQLSGSFIQSDTMVESISIMQGNQSNTADGLLSVTLCSLNNCTSGEADLSQSKDNTFFLIRFFDPLLVKANNPISFSIKHIDGTVSEAIWVFPTRGNVNDQNLKLPNGQMPNMGGMFKIHSLNKLAEKPNLVFSDNLMDIYELPHPKPYFDSLEETCKLTPNGRLEVEVDCPQGGSLIRRELFFPGWSVSVNGKEQTITSHKEIFQEIEVPKGLSQIKFSFSPPYSTWAWLMMGMALLRLVISRNLLRNILRINF